jgi:hypothetical protein
MDVSSPAGVAHGLARRTHLCSPAPSGLLTSETAKKTRPQKPGALWEALLHQPCTHALDIAAEPLVRNCLGQVREGNAHREINRIEQGLSTLGRRERPSGKPCCQTAAFVV